jgi:hypothetical protein
MRVFLRKRIRIENVLPFRAAWNFTDGCSYRSASAIDIEAAPGEDPGKPIEEQLMDADRLKFPIIQRIQSWHRAMPLGMQGKHKKFLINSQTEKIPGKL